VKILNPLKNEQSATRLERLIKALISIADNEEITILSQPKAHINFTADFKPLLDNESIKLEF